MRHFIRHAVRHAVLLVAGVCVAGSVGASRLVLVQFDGAEAAPGSESFAHAGSHWHGGRIESEGVPGLNASGAFFWVPGPGAELQLDPPATALRFFYVHGFGHPEGTATAHAADGRVLGTVTSTRAGVHGADEGYVAFDTAEPIARVAFTGGVVDSVEYRRADAGIAITPDVNGAWVNVSHPPFIDGQGLMIEYVPEADVLFVAWFTWDDHRGTRWLVAQGPVDGGSATLDVFDTRAGRLNRPDPVERDVIGRMSISLTACDRATVQLSMPGVVGTDATFDIARLRRLVTGVAACEAERAGSTAD